MRQEPQIPFILRKAMTRLYNSRKSKLLSPLTMGEGGFVFESKHINQLIDDINGKKYGSYLIGGVVGSGKSSMVDMASSYAKDETILLHVKFYNEEECIDKFLLILLEKIIEVVKKDGYIEKSEELKIKIEKCEKELFYDIDEQKILEKSTKQELEMSSTGKTSGNAGVGFSLSKFLFAKSEVGVEVIEEEKESENEEENYKETCTMTKRQDDKMQDIIGIFSLLLPRNIVIVYDELDKMSKDVLQELFAKYKGLFVENQIFNFFIVNEAIYMKYSDTNLFQNPYLTYFSGIYYISMLDFRDTLRYITMMFGERKYINGLVTYYTSLGNYRLINTMYLAKQEKKSMEIVKAFIHKKVIEKMTLPYLNECDKDLLVIAVKNVVEVIIKKRKIERNDLVEALRKTHKEFEECPDYFEMVKNVINEIEGIVPEAVSTENGTTVISVDSLWKHAIEIEELAIKDRIEEITEDKQHLIQYSDMYPYLRKEYIRYRGFGIPYISKDVIPLQVANNQTEAYMNILTSVLRANLEEDNLQVIVLKRARGEESYYRDDHVYTGIVVVNKGRYEVAYYVNEGCYDSDGYETLKKFISEAKKLGISVPIIEIETRIDLQKNIKDVVEVYNNI